MSYTIEEITKHQFEITAICIDGEYWDIDYVNNPIDNPKLECKRFYYDDLSNNSSVVLLKEQPIESEVV